MDRDARARLTDTRIMAIADMIEAAIIEAVKTERDEIVRLRRCRDALKAIMQAHGPGTLASDDLYAMAVDALGEG